MTAYFSSPEGVLPAQDSPYIGGVPLRTHGRIVTAAEWNLGGVSFPAAQWTLPLRNRFGSVMPKEVYIGYSLLDGSPMWLPRLGHSGWVPIAKYTLLDEQTRVVTPITPVLPRSSITAAHTMLRSGAATSVAYVGSSLLANGQGTNNMSGWLSGAAASRYGLNWGGSTITTVNASYGGMGPRYHFAILHGKSFELNASGSVTLIANTAVPLTGVHAARSGRPYAGRYSTAHYAAQTGLLILEVSANGGSNYALFQEGILRAACDSGMRTLLVLGNAFGGSADTFSASATWTDAARLIQLATELGVPVADAAAFMLAGFLDANSDADGLAQYYSDGGTHPSVGTPGGQWPPNSGYDGYAHAIASVARPAVPLQPVEAVRFQRVTDPNIPLAATIYFNTAIQTNTAAVTRGAPYRSIAAAPHHILNQFGETNTLQMAAASAVAFGFPFVNTVDILVQGGDVDNTLTLTPSGGTLTVNASTNITNHFEAWTLARLSNPPVIQSRGLKITNGAEGVAHIVAAIAFQPAWEYVPLEVIGTFTRSVVGFLESLQSNTVGDAVIARHPACSGLYVLVYSGSTTAGAVLTRKYDGIATTDYTLATSGGYAGVVQGQKFSVFGEHDFELAVKTAASGGGTMALVPASMNGAFAILSG